MKRFLTTLFLLLCAAGAHAQGRTPLARPYLTTPLDGNAQSITNAGDIAARDVAIRGLTVTNEATFSSNVTVYGNFAMPGHIYGSTRKLTDSLGNESINWGSRRLFDELGNPILDWASGNLDLSGSIALDGSLTATGGTTRLLDVYLNTLWGGGGTNNIWTNQVVWVNNPADGTGIVGSQAGSALLWRVQDNGVPGAYLYALSPSMFAVYTNALFLGSNIVSGPAAFRNRVIYPRRGVGTIAAGANAAVPLGTNVWCELSGNTSAATLAGLDGQPNADGDFKLITYNEAYELTVANESGLEPVPANRILTPTGGDIESAGPCALSFIYSSAAGRWRLLQMYDGVVTSSSPVAGLDTNTAYTWYEPQIFAGGMAVSNEFNLFGTLFVDAISLNGETRTTWPTAGTGTTTNADDLVAGTLARPVDNDSVTTTNLVVRRAVQHERVYLVTAFGAKGDGIQRMGTIPDGSSTLTISTNGCFTEDDIGKVIIINGVGPNSNTLNSVIVGVTASNICTISGVASTTILPHNDYQNVVYGTDDTIAIQKGIDYTSTNGGGTLFFPYTDTANRPADKNGTIYLVNGPLINYWTNSYQLRIPELPPVGQMSTTIRLEGPQAPAARQFVDVGSLGAYPHAEDWGKSGVTLWSTRPTGYLGQGKRAMLAAWNTNTPSYEFDLDGGGTNDLRVGWNAVRLEIENLTFRVAPNPDMVALCLDACATIRLRSVWVDCGWNEYQGPEPTNVASIGIDFPLNNNSGGGSLRCSDTVVSGFYTGMRLSEHAEVDNCCVTSCKRAYWLYQGGHEITMINANAEGCLYAIYGSGGYANLNCYGMSVENSTMYGGTNNWWRPAYIFYETTDGAYNGFIEYTYTSSDTDLLKNGGKWMTTRRKPYGGGAVSTFMSARAGTNANGIVWEGQFSGGNGPATGNGKFVLTSNATVVITAPTIGTTEPALSTDGTVKAASFQIGEGTPITEWPSGSGGVSADAANIWTAGQTFQAPTTNTLAGQKYYASGYDPVAYQWWDSTGNLLFSFFRSNIYRGFIVGSPGVAQLSLYSEAGYGVFTWPKTNTMCFSVADNPGTDMGTTRVMSFFPSTYNVNIGSGNTDPGVRLNVEGTLKATSISLGGETRTNWPTGGGTTTTNADDLVTGTLARPVNNSTVVTTNLVSSGSGSNHVAGALGLNGSVTFNGGRRINAATTNEVGLGGRSYSTGSNPAAWDWLDSSGNPLLTVFRTNIYSGIKIGAPGLPQWSQYVETGYLVQSWPKSNTMCFSVADNPGTDSGSTRVFWIAPTTYNMNIGSSSTDPGVKLNVEGAIKINNPTGTPANTNAPVTWLNLTNNGTRYYVPLYQ